LNNNDVKANRPISMAVSHSFVTHGPVLICVLADLV